MTKRLKKLAETGQFKQLTIKKRQQIIKRIQRLQRQLNILNISGNARKAIAAATLALSLVTTNISAQSFDFKVGQLNPFGLSSGLVVSLPTLGDIDSDGDLDILYSTYDIGYNVTNLSYRENIGTATSPNFDTVVTNPFGINLFASGAFQNPALVDIDGDSDLDIITSDGNYGGIFYQNTGTSTSPTFAAADTAAFGLTPTLGYDNQISFADLDDDGDLDAVVGGALVGGTIFYYENTGTATAPQFAAPLSNPFGLISTGTIAFPEFVDFDKDNDFDLMVTEAGASVQYFENIGTSLVPNFTTPVQDPFGIDIKGPNISTVSNVQRISPSF